jgi:hypothetical protein
MVIEPADAVAVDGATVDDAPPLATEGTVTVVPGFVTVTVDGALDVLLPHAATRKATPTVTANLVFTAQRIYSDVGGVSQFHGICC